MTPPVEIEVKLVTTPAMLTRLKTLPRLVGHDKRVRLITTYFDTPDRRLEKVCLTLRTRSKRGNREQTVKMTSSADTALHRGEWTTPLVGEQPRIDKFPENIRFRLRLALGEVEPAALSVARIDRITRQLPINTSVIEIAFDTGTLEAGERSETICEVELELIEGQLQDLLKLALDLPLGSELQWSLVSKAQRCSALSLSKAMAATSAQAPMLSQAMDIATGFKAISWNCLDHLLLNYPLVIATGDAEALHQCRVAIRRLRVAWGLFAKLVGEDEQAVLEAGMKAVACRLGKARDLYVLHHRLALSDDQDHRSRAALSWLQKMLVGKTDQVRQVLSSASFQHLLFDTACWIEGGAWCKNAMKSKEQALARFAARRLSRHHQWLTQQKAPLETWSDHALHRLRIRVKKLRYTTDFFKSLWPERYTERFISRLGTLQDRLGDLHDLAVAAYDKTMIPDDPDPVIHAEMTVTIQAMLSCRMAKRKTLLKQADKALRMVQGERLWWHSS